jgi:allantoinase
VNPITAPTYLPYWPIVGRPIIRWPHGARIAFWIANNIEFYEFMTSPNRYRRFWTRVPEPDVLGWSLRDYGNRVGFWRLLDILDEFQLPVTASLNLAVVDHCPEIGEAILEREWDVLSHGIYNTEFLYGMSPRRERAWVDRNMEIFESWSGRKLKGMFGPAGSLTPNSMPIWAEAGIEYVVDWFVDDQPFPILTDEHRLVNVPYSWEVNDARIMGGASFGGLYEVEQFVKMFKDHFDTLYDEGEETGRVVCLPLHPYIIGQPWRIDYLREILDYVSGHEAVWLATAGEIATFYRDHCLNDAVNHMEVMQTESETGRAEVGDLAEAEDETYE